MRAKSVPDSVVPPTVRARARKNVTELRHQYEAAPPGARLKPAVVAVGMGLSPRTIERWRSTGQGPSYLKIGAACVRYLKRDVEAWMAANAEEFS